MRVVDVQLAARSYQIQIGPDLLSRVGETIRAVAPYTTRVAIVSDSNVAPLYAEQVETSLDAAGLPSVRAVVPAGEASKSLTQLGALYDTLLGAGIDRRSLVLALGGGVVGDLAGFAAATVLRGISFVQAPTTVLAQIDSSVGGKTGIDHATGKNLIGAFWQPRLVVTDIETLQTLPRREIAAGLAEVVKTGVYGDAEYFAQLEADADALLAVHEQTMGNVIARACQLKADIVAEDERETSGRRAILNLGHTVGHAVEAAAGYGVLLHGEAVAIGLIAAGELALGMKLWREEEHQRMVSLLQRLGLPEKAPGLDVEQVLRLMRSDKKAAAGRLTFVLPVRLGEVRLVDDVPEGLLRDVVTGRLRA